jgi:hypothetical protein
MTITFADMVNEVVINLSGYTLQQDRATYLKTAVTTTTSSSSSPLILSLGSTDNVGKGIIEIDEELMWVDAYDRIANTATIAPYGRGYLGTTAATHALDTRVVISPTFPRFSVKRAINDTINALSSTIYAVKTTTFVFNPAVNTYAFNDLGIKNILGVSWQSIGPTKEWVPVRHWDFDPIGSTTVFGAGAQTITINDSIVAGRTVKVMYAANAEMFTSDTQDYVTQTGMPDSTKDVVILGASYRLLSFLDPARATMVSPQADETDSKRPYGSSGTAVKQIYALYQQRLQEETRQQQQNFPTKVHYSRR